MWDKKDKITELPQGIEYSRDTQELNLTYTNVDMIPRGLKGVKGVKMLKVPTYIASDFSGDVYVSKGSGTFEKLSPIEIYKAKFSYMQDSGFVESLRYAGVASLELAVLPSNMRFYEKNGKAYLDLSLMKTYSVLVKTLLKTIQV